MIDAELLADLRRLLDTLRLPEYMRDLVDAVPDRLVKEIAQDFRSYNPHPAQDPSAKVSVQGAGVVKTGDVGPQHRPVDPSATNSGGWVEAKSIDSWRPPGLREMDAMMDAADLQDRLQRVKELGEARALLQAEAEIKAQQEAELSKKPKGGPQK
jgi:hypothetical protein